ncbi:DNA-methyltransferase [Methylorubrum extorquens]|uniref:DNA-methyltransferase n=1 Tax=Methylorubrum extorquens TaxID=408 RepID=UPI003F5F79C9
MTWRVEHLAEGVTVYCGDARDIVPSLGQFEAIITDPPYGIGFAAQPTKWQRRAGQKAEAWDDLTVTGLADILKHGERQVCWSGNYYSLPPSRGWLAWVKPDAPPSMASLELAWTNQNRNARQITHSIGATNAERVGHPTQKPLAVICWTLEQAGNPATVLDPFMGSGTTGVACVRSGAAFCGIEIEPKYFDLACRRIADELRRPRLFSERPVAPVQEALL